MASATDAAIERLSGFLQTKLIRSGQPFRALLPCKAERDVLSVASRELRY